MPTLGISAFYHDSAAALVGDDGSIIAAAQEERFTRRRHDAAWPSAAINYCMAEGRLAPSDLHGVVFYEIPARKFGRIVDGYRALGASGERIFSETFPDWMTHRGDQADWILAWLKQWDSAIAWENRLFFCEHHVSHAASAFYPSPFRKAAILTVDGVGERATTMMSLGQEGCLTPLRELHYPHSLGLLYSAFTHYTGFKVNSGEYKMMGLAPYGEPIYADRIREELIEIHTDGSFAINTDYVDSFASDRIINTKFEDLFGRPARGSQDPVTRLDVDLAASIQQVTEEAMLALAGAVCAETGAKDLCLAGGVALNCVANGKLVRSGLVDRLWVQPAPGDAGGALGAAYFGHYTRREPPPRSLAATGDSMRGAYLGPGYDDVAVEAALRTHRLKSERLERDAFLDRVAGLLAEGATIGWFQGRMEFGPRALGARSILADPRDSTMQRRLNIQVKQRESFRPFAPRRAGGRGQQFVRTRTTQPLHGDRRPCAFLPADRSRCRSG